jgi:electron transfer flavoprotein alpha subunit
VTVVLTLVEREDDGALAGSSRRVLTFARGVAADVGEVHAVVVGAVTADVLAACGEQGVARIHALEHDLLDGYAPEAWGEAVTQLLGVCEPRVVIAPGTGRGSEVLAHVAQGLSNREIGAALFISEVTVKSHLTRILRKLDATSRTHAVARARELHLL